MALSKLSLFLSLLAFAFLLSSNHVYCNENEDYVRKGINTYRKSLNLSALSNNEKASCLANEIADALEDQPCTIAAEFSGDKDPTGTVARLVNFQTLLADCDLETNTTFAGVVLPVCVPKLIGELVIGNYTRSRYAMFLNSSKFTGAGFGTEDDWTVIVLTTGKPSKKVSVTTSSGVVEKGFASLVLGFVFFSHLLF